MSIENRLAAKKRNQKARKKAAIAKIVKISLMILIPVAVICIVAGVYINYQSKKIEYSKYLTADGTIDGVKAKDLIETLADYKNLSIKLSDYEPTEQEIRKEIKNQYDAVVKAEEEAAKKEQSTDKKEESSSASSGTEDKQDETAEDKQDESAEDKKDESSEDKKDESSEDKKDESSEDKKDESSEDKKDESSEDKKDESSEDKKDDSDSDDISDEDYKKLLENITDAWVEKNFKEKMSEDYKCTQADFIKYITDTLRESKKSAMRSDITKFLNENSTMKEYPAKYTKNLIQIYRNVELQSFEQYAEIYKNYYGVTNVYDLYGGKDKFKTAMEENAKSEVKTTMILLAIYEEMGLSTTEADVQKYYTEDQGQDYAKLKEEYGKNYLMLQCKCAQVLDKLEESVK